MTKKEMERRIAEMAPKAIERITKMVNHTTYTAREIHAFRIPGSRSLAHINAIFQRELA